MDRPLSNVEQKLADAAVKLREAVRYDGEQKYVEAFQIYKDGILVLEEAWKMTTGATKTDIRTKMVYYMDRTDVLLTFPELAERKARLEKARKGVVSKKC